MLSNSFDIKVPTLTRALADSIALAAKRQLDTSIQYKAPRLGLIKENEDLYFGVVEKQLGNPFNEAFPFMSGAVDFALSRIDDPPRVRFKANRNAAYKAAKKFQAAWDATLASPMPDSKWRLKDRHGKKLAIMGGRAIHKYFAESPEKKYRSVFSTVDYKLFHSQPDGGGHLEHHLYCGEEGVFMTKEALLRGAQLGFYDSENVERLVKGTGQSEYQQNNDDQNDLYSRHAAMGLDPKNHSYVGQQVHNLVEWYLTFEGIRWYVLFDKQTGLWVRLKPLRELFSIPKGYEDALWPYTSWATFEEFGLFWSKGNADDWRPPGRYLNRLLNQELYSREKQNKGQRAYDPDMVPDVGALADWRPDGLVPVKMAPGKSMQNAFFEFRVGGLNGSLDLANYIESMVGRNTGNTPGSRGAAEKDKAVGVYFGEMQQIDEFVGTRNKSYTEMYEELAIRFLIGLKDNMRDEGIEIPLVGEAGFESETITKEDLEYIDAISISVVGGLQEDEKNFAMGKSKREILVGLQTVNPRWKDEQLLRSGPFNEEDIREAFNYQPNASKELISEAAQAIETIKKGRTPKMNPGANTAYMEFIVNAANANEELDVKTRRKMVDFALSHAKIAAQNEARLALALRAEQQAQAAAALKASGKAPAAPVEEKVPAPVPSPLEMMTGGKLPA